MNENAIVIQNSTPSPYVPSVSTVQSVMAIVEMAYKSGMVKVKNLDDARFIALYGLELSIPVMTALRCIYSVNGGAPTCSGELLLALIRRSGKVSIKISSTEETLKAERATVYMKRLDSGDEFTATWGKVDSVRAGLGGNNHAKYPAQMWTWRAVSICAKALCSDIVGGMYTIEEIYPDAKLDESGDIVGEVTVTRESAPQTPPTVQIPATSGNVIADEPQAPVATPEVKHDPNEWINGNVNTFLDKWLKAGMTYPQIKTALKINDRWGEWKGTVAEAETAVQAYRKPVSLPPEVTASTPKPIGDTPPVGDPNDEATLRRNTLARLEGEAVDLYEFHTTKSVAGRGKMAGDKRIAYAQIQETDGTTPRIDVTLFPEHVKAIRDAGHYFPQVDGAISIPVILHIENGVITINIEKQPLMVTKPNPFGSKPASDPAVDLIPGAFENSEPAEMEKV